MRNVERMTNDQMTKLAMFNADGQLTPASMADP
jgi:hypothetical protein